jgi:Thioesterase superfamily
MDASILKGRAVRESRSEYTYVALANDADPLGNLLGGRVMNLVEMCAWLAAQRHARSPIVTAAIDQMSFMHSRYGQEATRRHRAQSGSGNAAGPLAACDDRCVPVWRKLDCLGRREPMPQAASLEGRDCNHFSVGAGT